MAALLALHKPAALLRPQLWAEDGPIFLLQQDSDGLGALLIPYAGYLHAIPRLIAWAAALFLDPAYWPAFYNGASFVITLAVIARLFSSRLDLPAKPWIALAIPFSALTGEVLFNITNLQWIIVFVLLQQAVIAPPTTWGQRLGDWLLLLFVGLTGPFAVLLLPLFVWRWWHERRPDNLAALLLVAACAGLQGTLILRTGPSGAVHSGAFRLGPAMIALARRLFVWPISGGSAAPPLLSGLGCAVLMALFLWCLRPHPRRRLRAMALYTLLAVAAAGILRQPFNILTDTHYSLGARYFFVPRVLFAWILIWEFDAKPRVVAWLAWSLAVLLALGALRGYIIPAPPDLHWAEYSASIRRGEPATIPILPVGWKIDYPGRLGDRKLAWAEKEPLQRPVFLTQPYLLCSTRADCVFRLKGIYGPARFTETGLPAGLKLDAATGAIHGRPLQTGRFITEVTATNSIGTTTCEFTFQVVDSRFSASVTAPPSCIAGAKVELFYEAFDAESKLDFVDITDLTNNKFLGRIPAPADQRQIWQGIYTPALLEPGAHSIVFRFVRFDPRRDPKYGFVDRSVQIAVLPPPPK